MARPAIHVAPKPAPSSSPPPKQTGRVIIHPAAVHPAAKGPASQPPGAQRVIPGQKPAAGVRVVIPPRAPPPTITIQPDPKKPDPAPTARPRTEQKRPPSGGGGSVSSQPSGGGGGGGGGSDPPPDFNPPPDQTPSPDQAPDASPDAAPAAPAVPGGFPTWPLVIASIIAFPVAGPLVGAGLAVGAVANAVKRKNAAKAAQDAQLSGMEYEHGGCFGQFSAQNAQQALMGLGDITPADWYRSYFMPAQQQLNEAALQQPPELLGAMQVLIGRANAQALAILNGDTSEDTLNKLSDLLAKMQYAVQVWDMDDRSRGSLLSSVDQVLSNLPKDIKAFVVETTRTAGEALQAAGIDPAELAKEGSSTIKMVAGAAVVVGLAVIVVKVWPRKKKEKE